MILNVSLSQTTVSAIEKLSKSAWEVRGTGANYRDPFLRKIQNGLLYIVLSFLFESMNHKMLGLHKVRAMYVRYPKPYAKTYESHRNTTASHGYFAEKRFY